MAKRIPVLIIVVVISILSASCGGDYMPTGKKVTYPESVYDKAEFGKDKFN